MRSTAWIHCARGFAIAGLLLVPAGCEEITQANDFTITPTKCDGGGATDGGSCGTPTEDGGDAGDSSDAGDAG